MSHIPYLTKDGRITLMVDDQPFLILGGEVHNSSASDLNHMKERVWPGLQELGGNGYLVPVYWECIEPEPGKYDFQLVDGLLEQARAIGVHLVLLWFGLWKNGKSEYVPAWIKTDPAYDYMVKENGQLVESVSPLCEPAIALDERAFSHLLMHLKEVDEQHTVIMIQVENETGIWDSPRDYGNKANQQYAAQIPEDMAALYETSGTWEEVFGLAAPEYFMSYYFAKAVERIASADKAAYPLPFYMNCVDFGFPARAGQMPSGAPIPRVRRIWRAFAPSIDLYGPDIYAPNYKGIAGSYAQTDNALVIPELAQDKNVASKALYTVAGYNTICYSPFGIEALMQPISETDLLSETNTDLVRPEPESGALLQEAYRILQCMWPEIRRAQEENRIYAFLESGNPADEFVLDNYILKVSYGDGGIVGHMGQQGHRCDARPVGGGYIIRTGTDTFLMCGIACNLEIQPRYASGKSVFILSKREMRFSGNRLVPGRILNGDERNYIAIGQTPAIVEIAMYER